MPKRVDLEFAPKADFLLRVLLETKEQQEKRGRDKRDEMESKYSTCNDGRSVVVLKRGRQAKISADHGSGARELVFEVASDAAWRRLQDDVELRRQLKERHHLEHLELEVFPFDGVVQRVVSAVADELTLSRQAVALFSEVEKLQQAPSIGCV